MVGGQRCMRPCTAACRPCRSRLMDGEQVYDTFVPLRRQLSISMESYKYAFHICVLMTYDMAQARVDAVRRYAKAKTDFTLYPGDRPDTYINFEWKKDRWIVSRWEWGECETWESSGVLLVDEKRPDYRYSVIFDDRVLHIVMDGAECLKDPEFTGRFES